MKLNFTEAELREILRLPPMAAELATVSREVQVGAEAFPKLQDKLVSLRETFRDVAPPALVRFDEVIAGRVMELRRMEILTGHLEAANAVWFGRKITGERDLARTLQEVGNLLSAKIHKAFAGGADLTEYNRWQGQVEDARFGESSKRCAALLAVARELGATIPEATVEAAP
jgi:hypothetical protein